MLSGCTSVPWLEDCPGKMSARTISALLIIIFPKPKNTLTHSYPMTVQMLTNIQYPNDASTGKPSLITPAPTLHLTKISVKAYSTIWAHRDCTEWHAIGIIWLVKIIWMKKLDGYVGLGLFCHWESSVELYNFTSSLLNSPSTVSSTK